MDRTIRKVLGFKTGKDGASVIVGMQTVEGITVEIEVLPEMIMEFIIVLLEGRTQAWIQSEGGVPGDVPNLENQIRGVIPARKIVSARYPDQNKRLVQIVTEGDAIFEFLLPAPDQDQQGMRD